MLATACCTTWPPRVAWPEADATSWLATCEEDAVCCTVVVSCDSAATACWALLAVCSVRADKSWLPLAISWLATEMLPPASRTWATMAPRPACMSSSARCRAAASSRPSTAMRRDRSPLAIDCARARAASSGRQIETMFSIVDGTTTTTVISTARPNSHWVCSAMPAWRAMAPSASAPRAWSSACSFCAACRPAPAQASRR